MFEASIGYALIFRTEEDYNLCHDLLKLALNNLDLMEKHLEQLIADEAQLKEFFSSKLLQALAANLDLSSNELSSRQKIALEFVIKVIKF